MKKLITGIVVTFISLFVFQSCTRIIPEGANVHVPGKVKTIQLSNVEGIPMEFGSLISVIPDSREPKLSVLWFEDQEGTIRSVRVAIHNNRIRPTVLVFPRN